MTDVGGANRDLWARRAFVIALVVMAVLSTAVGVRNGIHRSQDFQWSGERLLVAHVDPWAVYLAGDPQHELILTQIPNYLAILYVLLIPLGLLSLAKANLVWALCNVGFAVVSAVLASRFYGLRGWSGVGLVCAMMIATPTRTAIGNGQQSLLVLFCWCASLLAYRLTDWRSAVAGIGYFKFTFGPPSFIYLWARGGWRPAVVSLLPAFAAVGAVWFWLTGGHDLHGLVKIALEPFRVARTGYQGAEGDPNLMSVLDTIFLRLQVNASLASVLELLAALAVSILIAWKVLQQRAGRSVQGSLAVMATMSFVLYMHHSYDGVVLLLPLCYAWRLQRETTAKWILALLAYVLYLERAIDTVQSLSAVSVWVEFVVLSAVLVLTCRLCARESDVEPARTWATRDQPVVS